jgi:cyanate lyase
LNKIQEAIQLIKSKKSEGMSYSDISKVTGFTEQKLYQWVRLDNLPSMKVAKKINLSLSN